MELFGEMNNHFYLLTVFAQNSILDIQLGSNITPPGSSVFYERKSLKLR